jgi:hypothetical protein
MPGVEPGSCVKALFESIIVRDANDSHYTTSDFGDNDSWLKH